MLSAAEAVLQAAEAARLEAEADATLAVRAAGESQWGSELPPLFMQKVLELLEWEPAIRAVCTTWSSFHDALLPRLRPLRSLAAVEGKLGWCQSVREVDLTGCENGDPGPLVELGIMPSLRSLTLPASCAERAVDDEAVCGLTTLTTLRFCDLRELDEDVEVVGEWVLDLRRLPTLTYLSRPREMLRRDGQRRAGAGQPDGPVRPQLLPQRHERGSARSEQPHRTHRPLALQLPQRLGRGEAGAAHSHPQLDDSRRMMRTLTTVQLLQSRPSAHDPPVRRRTAWRATYPSRVTPAAIPQCYMTSPPRCTAVSNHPSPP
jgi:hypothetical protein